MHRRNAFLACGAAALLPLAGCVIAPVHPQHPPYDVEAPVGPPAPQYEVIGVAPYPGWFWIGGHWAWRMNRHVWIGGHWSAPRHGWRWQPYQWYPHNRGWRGRPGYWAR